MPARDLELPNWLKCVIVVIADNPNTATGNSMERFYRKALFKACKLEEVIFLEQ